MTTLEAFERSAAETTADIVARLPVPAEAHPQPAPARTRPTCTWLIDAQTGRPICRWVVR